MYFGLTCQDLRSCSSATSSASCLACTWPCTFFVSTHRHVRSVTKSTPFYSLYAIFYLMFSTFARKHCKHHFRLEFENSHLIFVALELFQGTYGFKPGIGGLVYLGLGIGFFSSTIFGAK